MSSATILRERPIAPLPEVQFCAQGNCLWVLFEDDDYVPWCGIFGLGDLDFGFEIIAVGGGFLVFVAGRLYRVNANTRDLVFASEHRRLTNIIYVPQCDMAVAGSSSRVHCYGPERAVWNSEPFSPATEAVVLESCENNVVHGFFLEEPIDNVTPFVLDLDSMRFRFEHSVDCYKSDYIRNERRQKAFANVLALRRWWF